jgi:hypothetical protein
MRECRSQADAWSVVDDRASAESSLRRMLDHSMGVGYRKDYQTDEWIEWLGEVTKLQRDAAPTRFTWFAKAIPSLEETTEGRATNNASLTLLEKAFDWSPVRSVKLLSWLLAQGLVDFEDALSLMLTKVVTQSPGNRGLVVSVLQSTDAEQEAGLIILDAATRMRKSLPDCLVTRLAVLDSSPDFAIRTAAEEIGSRLGVSASRNDAKVELPAIYRFALPPSELDGPEVDGTVDGGEPLPDSENPEQIVRPFGTELDAIASETGIARANIYYRCVQIMKNLSPADDWSAEAEKKLREQLRGIGLRFPFHRPRAAAARRAMLRVVAECVDAGLLDTDRNGFSRLLRFYDPYFVTGQPSARPREIESIGGVSDSGMVKDEWLSQGGDALSSICRNLSGGFIVIGEETRLKGLGWELPEENRLSSLVDPSIGPSDEDLKYRYLFNTLVNACVSDYPTSYASRTLSRLLVRNEGYGFETPGADWLALNPAVGRLCGWQLSDSGLFEWHSVGGELMVKSIWWVDGNVDHAPPHHQDQVGEGWIVVASQRALESLSKCLGPFERQAEIVRSARINDRHMRTFASKRGPV